MGYKIVKKIIKKNKNIQNICKKTNNLYNATNFYIRQCYFAKNKTNKILNSNEMKVLEEINNTLPKLDERTIQYLQKGINKLKMKIKQKPDKENIDKLNKLEEKLKNFKKYEIPESGMLSYNILEGVFKINENVDYKALPVQVAQQTIRQCFQDWKSFFQANKEYKINPDKFQGKPKPPKYKKSGAECMTRFTNQVSKLYFEDNQCFLKLTGCEEVFSFGNYVKSDAILQ